MSSEKLLKIHFIGIGGIGISALARLFLLGGKDWVMKNFGDVLKSPIQTSPLRGGGVKRISPTPALPLLRKGEGTRISITGSDLVESEVVLDLRKLGAEIVVGEHKKENLFFRYAELVSASSINDVDSGPAAGMTTTEIRNGKNMSDLVVYSAAVPKDNLELKEAKKLKIPCLTYAQAVGELTKKMFTIAISGMHGKSTTTAMLALVLEKAGLDPTVIIGTKLKQWNGANARLGKSKYLVIEADEWQASFLNYWPKIIVLTNIEEEHLDYYRDLSHIMKTFKKYLGHLPEDGYLVANGDDINIRKFLKSKSQITNFKQISNNKFQIINRFQICNFLAEQLEAAKLRVILKIPGQHNVSNALAVLSTARILNVKDEIIFQALSEFTGTWRRFEELELKITIPHPNLPLVRGRSQKNIPHPDLPLYEGEELRVVRNLKLRIISDYGHHPTEVKATLQATKEKYPDKKIWVLFQPHQYQRTHYLFDRFVNAFDLADGLILMKIYDVAGRGNKALKQKVSSTKLAQAIRQRDQKRGVTRQVLTANDLDQAKQLIVNNVTETDILIVMGAGDIYKILDSLNSSTHKE